MKRTLSIITFLLLTLMAQAQVRHVRIYQRGGVVDTLSMVTGSSFTHSKLDLLGREQPDYVSIDVQAEDTTCRYLIADIDSIVTPGGRLVLFRGSTVDNDSASLLRHSSLSGDFPGTEGKGNVTFYWTENDPIRLDAGYESRAMKLSADKTSASFLFDADDLEADSYTVYFPDKYVTIPAVQYQTGADNTDHLRASGDCGVATATRGEDGTYSFTLKHKATYFCFLPHINYHPSIKLTRIDVVSSDRELSGTYSLNTSGINWNIRSNTTRNISLMLTPRPTVKKDFILGHSAATEQDSVAAYMVTIPQSYYINFAITYYLTDTLSRITRTYQQVFTNLNAGAANTVYTVTCNIPEDLFRTVDLGGDHVWANINAGNQRPNDAETKYALADSATAMATVSGGWQLPSKKDVDYLLNQCTWKSGNYNGTDGWFVSGTRLNENSEPYRLFLPNGNYWTGTAKEENSTRNVALSLTATEKQDTYQEATTQLLMRPVGVDMPDTLIIPKTGIKNYNIGGARRHIKIYDSTGPGVKYEPDCKYGSIFLNFASRYKVYVHGTVYSEWDDRLGIYDRYGNRIDPTRNYADYYGSPMNVNFTTTTDFMNFWFYSDGGTVNDECYGVDVTLDYFDADKPYAINVSEAENGKVTSSAKTSLAEQTVTLNAEPAEGYLLKDLVVTTADSTLCLYKNASGKTATALADTVRLLEPVGWYNNHTTFYMPYGDVTVKPTFAKRSDIDYSINMPKHGTATVDSKIIADLDSFKVYDSGGPSANYGDNEEGYLVINIPDGYKLHISGTSSSEYGYDKLNITDDVSLNTTIQGDNQTVDITSAGSEVILYFHSDRSQTRVGFDLTAELVKNE